MAKLDINGKLREIPMEGDTPLPDRAGGVTDGAKGIGPPP
jgi:hypothetical protein